MLIIDRQSFLAIEGSVLYTKLRKNCGPDEGLFIKVGNAGNNDWRYDSIDAAGALECGSSDELWEKISSMEKDPNEHAAIDYETTSRDGFFEGDDVKFVVFDKADVERLSGRISKLLENMK